MKKMKRIKKDEEEKQMRKKWKRKGGEKAEEKMRTWRERGRERTFLFYVYFILSSLDI